MGDFISGDREIERRKETGAIRKKEEQALVRKKKERVGVVSKERKKVASIDM
ncbi:hypothetical protein HanRHA438_Chr06g0258271 [Helianthus annuus]|nr:hypothetical protein HanRHA438_Chr06g0258271 [Helianthus annuus]